MESMVSSKRDGNAWMGEAQIEEDAKSVGAIVDRLSRGGSSSSSRALVSDVRAVKNLVIGNPRYKRILLHLGAAKVRWRFVCPG